jgi:hypothetical protein
MQTKACASHQTSFLMPALGEQLDPRQPLKRLADALPWSEFEQAFGKYYSAEGRPAKPVRLMVGLPSTSDHGKIPCRRTFLPRCARRRAHSGSSRGILFRGILSPPFSSIG